MFAKINHTMDKVIGTLTKKHPIILYLLMFFVSPAVVLLSVFVITYVIMLPIAFVSGWV